jgi:hypothetical protein
MSPRVATARRESLRIGPNLLFAWLVTAGFAFSQAPVFPPQAKAIRATVAELQKVQSPPEQRQHPQDVPEAAKSLLKQLEHQLRDLIAATLNDQSVNPGGPDRLTAELIGTLEREGVRVGEEGIPDTQFFGGVYEIKVRRPAGHPELLAATTHRST